MNASVYNEREDSFAQYFNLRKRKKEFAQKKVIDLPSKKQYFGKTREYLKGESEDIEAIADYIAYDEINLNKKNFGFNIKYNQLALDGADNDSKAEKAAMVAKQKVVAAVKKKAADAIKKRIFRRVIIRTTLQSLNAVLSTIGTIFGIFITLVFIIISVLLWIIGMG